VLSYLEIGIKRATSQTVSLNSATTYESSVELDPRMSKTWQITIYERVAKGSFVVDRSALKESNIEMPFELVISKRIEAKPIKAGLKKSAWLPIETLKHSSITL
jgi:hypothetical protein